MGLKTDLNLVFLVVLSWLFMEKIPT